MDTLALTAAWDLDVDAFGNLATFGDATAGTATGAGMRLAQDVATRCLAWRGEVYYDTEQGIRYEKILGEVPNFTLLQSAYNTEALKVPFCRTALVDFALARDGRRAVTGTLMVSDTSGNVATVNLT